LFFIIIPLIPLKSQLFGGFNPSEKYESQIGSSSQLLGNIKHVPNHQPASSLTPVLPIVFLVPVIRLGIPRGMPSQQAKIKKVGFGPTSSQKLQWDLGLRSWYIYQNYHIIYINTRIIHILSKNIYTYIYIYIHTYTYIHIYITLHYITLHCIALHCIALHYITLHYIHYHTIPYHTIHYITLHCIALHYITLHYITLHT